MKSFFRILGKSTAVIFSVLFVGTALLSIVLVTLGSRLFNPDLYKRALQNQQVYESLPGIIGEMLVTTATYDPCAENPLACEGMSAELAACYQQELGDERFAALSSGEAEPDETEQVFIQACLAQYGGGNQAQDASSEGGMPEFFRFLDGEDWAALISSLLPPEELETMTGQVLDGVFGYLKGDAERATVSFLPLKQRLEGSGGEQVLRELITSQPDCTDELLQFVTGVLPMDELTLCNPPEELLPLALSTVRGMLDEAIPTIPDEVVILPPKGGGTGAADAVLGVRWARLIMFLSPMLPMVFLGLVALFGVRSLKGWMRWWGIPLTITGGIALAGSLKMLLLWGYAWDRWVTPNFPAYLGETVVPLARGLAGFVLRDLALWIGLGGLLLLLMGTALWVGARFVKKGGSQGKSS